MLLARLWLCVNLLQNAASRPASSVRESLLSEDSQGLWPWLGR